MVQLSVWDWTAIIGYLVVSLGVGIFFARRGGRSIADFFCSGRAVPWWLLGVSMVATTFAADTPLAVTGFVAKNGIAGNWLWWSMVISGMVTTFFFARLWRRSEVLTDVELAELRYGGRPAKALRVIRALYLAFPINCIVMGWVTIAIFKVIKVNLGCSEQFAWNVIYALYGIVCLYVMLAGLWGILATDFIQFIMAMVGSVVLAVYALDKVGGVAQLKAKLVAQHGPESADAFLRMLPRFDAEPAAVIGSYALGAFLVMVTVQWWSAWYPGAEPGGGGYIAQRMFSARNERHALLAVLLFNVAHYALRPWPWIVAALCSIVLYPELQNTDPEQGYPKLMVDLLPPGLLGLMLVAFLAAFMSTISTQVNWGSSYVVNDVYKRFLVPDAGDRHYVFVSRVVTVITIGLGIVVSRQFESVKQAWEFILALGAGTGLVLILRWYWWRINAWSEIAAMTGSLVMAGTVQYVNLAYSRTLPDGHEIKAIDHSMAILAITGFTTLCWLVVTFATAPERRDTLVTFYRKARPGGPGWSRVRAWAPEVVPDRKLGVAAVSVVLGMVVVYAALFGIGQLILASTWLGILLLLLAAASLAVILHLAREVRPLTSPGG